MDISSKPVTVSLDSYLWGSRRDDTQVTLTLKHENGILDALFCVREKELRRMVSEPNGKVWTDSCVELFIKAEDSSEYSNFEFSASGAFLACHGLGRKDRIRYSEEERKNIECSVRILENNNRQSRYEVHVRLNLLALGLVSENCMSFYMNAYKCGDGLKEPHFIALFNIDTPQPDFHRSEFFRKVTLV